MRKSIYIPRKQTICYISVDELEHIKVENNIRTFEHEIRLFYNINEYRKLGSYSDVNMAIEEMININNFLLDENARNYIMTEEDK